MKLFRFYTIILLLVFLLSCNKKEYVQKIIVFEDPHCVQKGTLIWNDGNKIGKIVEIHQEKDRFIAKVKIVKEFHMYYSIIPYLNLSDGKCYLLFETKNSTHHDQTDTIFVSKRDVYTY